MCYLHWNKHTISVTFSNIWNSVTQEHLETNPKLIINTIITLHAVFFSFRAAFVLFVVKKVQFAFILIATKQSPSLPLLVCQSVTPLPLLKGPEVLCALLLMRYKPELPLIPQLQALLWTGGLLGKAIAVKDTGLSLALSHDILIKLTPIMWKADRPPCSHSTKRVTKPLLIFIHVHFETDLTLFLCGRHVGHPSEHASSLCHRCLLTRPSGAYRPFSLPRFSHLLTHTNEHHKYWHYYTNTSSIMAFAVCSMAQWGPIVKQWKEIHLLAPVLK